MTHLTYQVYLGPNLPLTCLVTILKGTFTLYFEDNLVPENTACSFKPHIRVMCKLELQCENFILSNSPNLPFPPLPHAESEVTDFHCTGIHWGCSGFLVGMINDRPHPLITSIHILQCSCSSMQRTSFHVSFSIQCVCVKWRYNIVCVRVCTVYMYIH